VLCLEFRQLVSSGLPVLTCPYCVLGHRLVLLSLS
jgi:hypothetical protein